MPESAGIRLALATDRPDPGHTPPMKSLLLAALGSLLVVSGCAETTSLTVADAAPSATDSPSSAVGDAALADGAACPAPVTPTPAAACAGLTELASPANLVAGVAPGVTTYALASLPARANRERPTCADQPWQDGNEAAVRFTAPVGGRWRLTGRGLHLATLRASRGCGATGVCAGFGDYHGPYVSVALTVDVQAQRGEGFAVVMDGCPVGETCSWDLRAERIGALACDFARGDTSPCTTDRVCSIGACDPERFVCVPAASDRLDSARIDVDRVSNQGFIAGRLRPLPAGSMRPRPPLLMVDWLRADGTDAPRDYYGLLTPDGVEFTAGPTGVPMDAVRARLWLYDTARPMEPQVAEGVEVAVEPWSPRAASERCDDARLLEQCARGLRCADGVCVRSTALEVTSLRAWRDPAGASLRLRIGGSSLGETVTQATVELLDAAGAVLTSAPAQSVYSSQRTTSMVPFTSALTLRGDRYRAALSGTTRVRVRVTDTMSRQSAPFEAAVEATEVVGVGASCDEPSVSCGGGLRCPETSSSNESRCEPLPAPRACELSARPGTWAPPASGTWTIEGTSRGGGGGTSCQASRTLGVATAEFVAPTSGRYVFETRGLWVMDLRSACDAPEPMVQCLRDAPDPRLEVDLRAGERMSLAVMSMSTDEPFAVTVRVP